MLTGAIVTVVALALAALTITFFVARRALRLFVRLALVLIAAVLLIVGYVAWRWQAATTPAPARNERRQSAPARR